MNAKKRNVTRTEEKDIGIIRALQTIKIKRYTKGYVGPLRCSLFFVKGVLDWYLWEHK